MNIDWQQAIALGLAALAAGYIGRRAWRRFSSKNTCAACAACGGGRAPEAKQDPAIVPIESLTQSVSPADNNDAARSQ